MNDSELAAVKKLLTDERLSHTMGVVKMAKELAIRYGADEAKAEKAAWYHDIFRRQSEAFFSFLPKSGMNAEEYPNLNLLHGPLAAKYLELVLGEQDDEVLNAVCYHTTARAGMGKLEKILFIADKCEEGRSYPGVESLRELAETDLDGCVLAILKNSMEHLKQKGVAPDVLSREAIEYLSGEEYNG